MPSSGPGSKRAWDLGRGQKGKLYKCESHYRSVINYDITYIVWVKNIFNVFLLLFKGIPLDIVCFFAF